MATNDGLRADQSDMRELLRGLLDDKDCAAGAELGPGIARLYVKIEALDRARAALSREPVVPAAGDAGLEPTNEELSVAWTTCISLAGIPGAGTEALIALQQLRNRRSTWFGENENRMRVVLDDYLRSA